MSPASNQELKVERCATKIEYLENSVGELKEKFEKLRYENTRSQERISDRRLTLYIAIASTSIAFLFEIIRWFVGLSI